MAERTGLPDPAPSRVSQAKTQPTHRTITHTGAQVKHSLRRGRFWIKEAPSRAAAAITAEMVRMATHSRGRRVPRRLLMKSARIFTRMVQVPWNFTGIIKMRIPTAEGIRNIARFDFCLTGMGHLRDGGVGWAMCARREQPSAGLLPTVYHAAGPFASRPGAGGGAGFRRSGAIFCCV